MSYKLRLFNNIHFTRDSFNMNIAARNTIDNFSNNMLWNLVTSTVFIIYTIIAFNIPLNMISLYISKMLSYNWFLKYLRESTF